METETTTPLLWLQTAPKTPGIYAFMQEIDDPIQFVEVWELTVMTERGRQYGWTPPGRHQDPVFLAKLVHEDGGLVVESDSQIGYYQCVNDGAKVPVPLTVPEARTPKMIEHDRKVRRGERAAAKAAKEAKEKETESAS